MANKAASTKKKNPVAASASAKTTKTTVKSVEKTVETAPASATKNTFVGYIQQSVRSVTLWRALAAEFIGTFLLAATIVAGSGQPIFVLFAFAGIILTIGAISGAHVNPAVTIGAFVTRRIGWLRALGYIVAQALGAAFAYVVLSSFLAGADPVDAQAQLYGQAAPSLFAATQVSLLGGKEWFIFFSELVGAAILAFAIANATRETQDRVAAALTGGFGLFIALMVSISVAGYVGGSAIINPAVAITLQAYDWANFWSFAIYGIAPLLGGIVGFVLYDLLRVRTVIK